jgi:hypothetical protein
MLLFQNAGVQQFKEMQKQGTEEIFCLLKKRNDNKKT